MGKRLELCGFFAVGAELRGDDVTRSQMSRPTNWATPGYLGLGVWSNMGLTTFLVDGETGACSSAGVGFDGTVICVSAPKKDMEMATEVL